MKRRTYARPRGAWRHMSPAAATVLRGGLALWIYLLFCALVMLLRGQPYSLETCALFARAREFHQAAFMVYFCTGFLACFVEERSLK